MSATVDLDRCQPHHIHGFTRDQVGQVVGFVTIGEGERAMQHFEVADWFKEHEFKPGRYPVILCAHPYYGFTLVASDVPTTIVDACMVSLCGGMQYGPDTAGRATIGQAATKHLMIGWGGSMDRIPAGRLEVDHNGQAVRRLASGLFQVADFTGRLVVVVARSATAAAHEFVRSHVCNLDTPLPQSTAWRSVGCPTRAAWLELVTMARETADLIGAGPTSAARDVAHAHGREFGTPEMQSTVDALLALWPVADWL